MQNVDGQKWKRVKMAFIPVSHRSDARGEKYPVAVMEEEVGNRVRDSQYQESCLRKVTAIGKRWWLGGTECSGRIYLNCKHIRLCIPGIYSYSFDFLIHRCSFIPLYRLSLPIKCLSLFAPLLNVCTHNLTALLNFLSACLH